MAKITALHHAFNVGVVDTDKLHRVDYEKMRLAAERQTNLPPDSVGKMFLRPGTAYIGTAPGIGRLLPFVAGYQDAFVLELTDELLRVLDPDTDTYVTRPTVTAAITSDDFSASTGWTLTSDTWQAATVSGGQLNLSVTAHGGRAYARQQVTVNEASTEHAVRITVARGPVQFRIGSTSGGEEYLAETTLHTGTHSIAFTPTGDFYVELSSVDRRLKLVDSIEVEAAGVMTLPTIWAEDDLGLIRFEQSLDVMFCAARGYRRQRIERRGDTSWSVVDYVADDGPFLLGRSTKAKLTPSVLEGNGTLTSDIPYFNANMVGALFQLYHEGQSIDTYVAGARQYTDAFKVTGITESNFAEREFDVTISGTWSGTLRHERSFDGEFGDYHPYRREQASATVNITANASFTNDDNDDNLEVWVKMGFSAYTSGAARVQFTYDGGGGYGVCRVTGFTDDQTVSIEVLTPFKGTHATESWREGQWSSYRGHPSGVAMHDGRLVWVGDDQFNASVSDAFDVFDEDYAGDAGPLLRSIAIGGRNRAEWAMSLGALMIGCDSLVAGVVASSLNEILTPSNFGIRKIGMPGAGQVTPVELSDDRGVYVDRSGVLLYEVRWEDNINRYVTRPFSRLQKDLYASGATELAFQVTPEQRVFVICDSDDMKVVTIDNAEQVPGAHIKYSTGADTDFFTSVCAVPGGDQDRVYVIVKRVVDSSTVYYVEKFAKESEAKVGDITKCLDSHILTGTGSATISGLDHLEGRTVVAWVDGDTVDDAGTDDMTEFTVSGGSITLPSAPATGGIVGLPYVGQYKSAKLAYGVGADYAPTAQNKSLASLGLLLADFVRSGVQYGTIIGDGFPSTLYDLPDASSATGLVATEVVSGPGDEEYAFSAGSEIGLDMRACLQITKPATVLSIVMGIEARG